MVLKGLAFERRYVERCTGGDDLYRNQQLKRNPAMNSPTFYDNSVEVTISAESHGYYRKSLTEMGKGNKEVADPVPLGKICQEDLESAFGNMIRSRKAELKPDRVEDSDNIDLLGGMKNFLTAYASIYDEIVKGYEEGTREYWVGAENGFRRVTKEEELEALDKAADTYAFLLDNGIKANVIRAKTMKKIEETLNLGKRQLKKEDYWLKYENELMGKDIYKELLSAIDAFKSQYSVFARDLVGNVNKAVSENITISISNDK